MNTFRESRPLSRATKRIFRVNIKYIKQNYRRQMLSARSSMKYYMRVAKCIEGPRGHMSTQSQIVCETFLSFANNTTVCPIV